MKQLSLTIHGRVHGVWFRASTQEKAKSLGLAGYVKNNEDRTVGVLAEGSEEKLKEFLEWCWNGPELAAVDKMDEEWKEVANANYNNFTIEY